MSARFSIDNYINLLLNLLPTGRAWPREPESVLYRLLSGFAPECRRMEERSRQLIDEAHPLTATETIGEWEAEQGFPDRYYDIPADLNARRQQVASRMYFSGTHRIPNRQFWIELGARLGYTITDVNDTTDSEPFEVGKSGVGEQIGEGLWGSVVTVYVDGPQSSGAKLEGIFNKLKHSHLTYVYIYTS